MLDTLTTQQKALLGFGGGGLLLFVMMRGRGGMGSGASQLAVVDVRRPTDDANIMGGGGDRQNTFIPYINVNPVYGTHPMGWDPVTSKPDPPKPPDPPPPPKPTPPPPPVATTPPPPEKKRPTAGSSGVSTGVSVSGVTQSIVMRGSGTMQGTNILNVGGNSVVMRGGGRSQQISVGEEGSDVRIENGEIWVGGKRRR